MLLYIYGSVSSCAVREIMDGHSPDETVYLEITKEKERTNIIISCGTVIESFCFCRVNVNGTALCEKSGQFMSR